MLTMNNVNAQFFFYFLGKMFGSKLSSLCWRISAIEQRRGFATLKDISIRLKSVRNIQKITKSMKMVSAAKYNKAERELRVIFFFSNILENTLYFKNCISCCFLNNPYVVKSLHNNSFHVIYILILYLKSNIN